MMTALVWNEIIKFQLHVDKHYLYPVPLYTTTISGIVIIRFAPKENSICIAPFNIMDPN